MQKNADLNPGDNLKKEVNIHHLNNLAYIWT